MSVLSSACRTGAKKTFRIGALESREAVPDDTEVFAAEQYHRADTPLRNQTPDDRRDQTDIFLCGIVQD